MGRGLIQAGYSGAVGKTPARPHDLLWVTPQPVPDNTPDWALPVLANGGPFVVRRALRRAGQIPVGVRGAQRCERLAMAIGCDVVSQTVSPEGLVARITRPATQRREQIAALGALPTLAALFNAQGLSWGLTGAVGYELATGQPTCHAASDIDMLLRVPEPITRRLAGAIIAWLGDITARCDIQMETPLGGVALADWAANNDQVLVKSDQGPFLCADPWHEAPPDQLAPCALGS